MKWPPEMWPRAYAAVTTVRPKARETPRKPMPVLTIPSWKSERKMAAITAAPVPPNTSHSVPSISAIALRCRSMEALRGR